MVDQEDLDTRLREISEAKEFCVDERDHKANNALASIMHTNAI